MSLNGALSIAMSGLANVNYQLGVVAQNVTNAGTPGYLTEVATQSSLTTGDQPLGVASGPTGLEVDTALQSSLYAQNGVVAGLQTTQSALQQIDGVQGTPGQPGDLTGLVGALGNAFSTLENDPSNQAQQSQVVNAAQALSGQINALANAVGTGRQTAQNSVAAVVGSINGTLGTIGSLSNQIIQAHAAGKSTADYENQRNAALSSLSSLVGIRYLEQPDGDMLITTTNGLELPIHGDGAALATANANVGAGSSYPGGGIPPITMNGVDVTAALTGGQLGANIALRDQTLPGYQAQLDEFAETVSNRFAQQGLTLFTDPTGTVPTPSGPPTQAGYVGYANIIQVNPAVAAQPTLVRDGTNTIAGSPTGASAFTPNPPGGPVGFNALIQRVVSYSLGAAAQPGVAQTPPAVTGLGPAGTLSAPYAAPPDLGGFAAALVGAEANDSSNTTAQLGTEQAVQTTLSSNLSSEDGVNLDQQMSNMVVLQNAYGANAKVVAAVQSMWAQLLQM
jgi:flagellar hook-associated protein 1 FlgK